MSKNKNTQLIKSAEREESMKRFNHIINAHIREMKLSGKNMDLAETLHKVGLGMCCIEIYTHSGVFHADDVFSAALIRLMVNIEKLGSIDWDSELHAIMNSFTTTKINRVNEVPESAGENVLIFDIGGGKYDHHQQGAPVRENGIPYAAFGLLWKELGMLFLGKRAKWFDKNFVQPLDATDNGAGPNTLSLVIGSMRPRWDRENPETTNAAFEEAVKFATEVLLRQFLKAWSSEDAETFILEKWKEQKEKTPHLLILSQYVPWTGFVTNYELNHPNMMDIWYVVYPSNRGGYNLEGVPKSPGTLELKYPLPEGWLAEKPNGCTFVHNGLFLANFKTKEKALEALSDIL